MVCLSLLYLFEILASLLTSSGISVDTLRYSTICHRINGIYVCLLLSSLTTMPISLPSRLLHSFSITADIPVLQLTFLLGGQSSPLNQAEQLQRSVDLAKVCLEQAQHYMPHYANSKRRDLSFQVGDFVLFSSKNLAHRYFGPFEIVRKVGSRAYELDIPPIMKAQDVFHVSLLKFNKHKDGPITVPPLALRKGDDTDTWLEEPEFWNCRDLLKAYCDGVKFSLSKRQILKTFKKQGRKRRKL